MLHVDDLACGHGPTTVLRAVTFTVPTATMVHVVGPNGTGKTTLVHTIAGLLRAHAGTVTHNGTALHRLDAHRVARTGVGLVPQGRRVFPSLTVDEHLTLAWRDRRGPWTTRRILDALPALAPLRHRHARHLSGGQQQMLAIARALSTDPSLLLLDEPAEGLAPTVAAAIAALLTQLTGEGVTVLVTAPDLTTVPHGSPVVHLRSPGLPEPTQTEPTAPSTRELP